MKREKPSWLDWYVIWRLGAIVLLGVALLVTVVHFLWDLDSTFTDQLRDKGYPAPAIEKSTTSLGGNKSQQLYIARVEIGTCVLRLERTQANANFYLKEANGRAVDDPDANPSKEQALAFLSSHNITCSR